MNILYFIFVFSFEYAGVGVDF